MWVELNSIVGPSEAKYSFLDRVSYRIFFWGGGEEFRKEGGPHVWLTTPIFLKPHPFNKNRLRSRISDTNPWSLGRRGGPHV